MAFYTNPYLYSDFNYPIYRQPSPAPTYCQHIVPRFPHSQPHHEYHLEDEDASLEREEQEVLNRLKAIQQKRKHFEAAKARAAAHAKAKAEYEEAIRAELAQAIAREEQKRKREEEKKQHEEAERKRRKAYVEAVERKQAEMKEGERLANVARAQRRNQQASAARARQTPKINNFDDLNNLLGAFFGINIAPSSDSELSDTESDREEQAKSTHSSKAKGHPTHGDVRPAVKAQPDRLDTHSESTSRDDIDAHPSLCDLLGEVAKAFRAKDEQEAEDNRAGEDKSGDQQGHHKAPQPSSSETERNPSSESSKSLSTLAKVEEQLAEIQTSFTCPTKLAFAHTVPGSHPPPLLFNRLNAPYHAQTNALLQLLLRADSVESNGDKEVRRRRKEVVKKVEEEIGRLERRRDAIWEEVKERRERGEESEPDESDERSWSDASSVQ